MRFSRYRCFGGERIFEILLCTRAMCIQVSPWDPKRRQILRKGMLNVRNELVYAYHTFAYVFTVG